MTPERVRLRIESLVHGGEGLARDAQGRVVFVRGAAPGDLVDAVLDEAPTERYLRARVAQVIEPGARVAAPCPYVGTCGGCPLQQVALEAQLQAKQALLRDSLERLGGVDLGEVQLSPIVPSPQPFHYRRRARFHRGPKGSWGFSSGDAVVAIDACLLLEPRLQELADATRAGMAELGGFGEVHDLGFDTSDTGKGAADLRTSEPPTAALRARAERLLAKVPGLRGLTLGPEGETVLVGDPVLTDAKGAPSLGAARLRSRPDLFAQANRAAVPLLQQAALDALGDSAGAVLELFCGTGTLTLPLLSRARSVRAVEFSAPALGLLRRSAEEALLGGPERLQLVAGDAAKVVQSLGAQRFDAAVIDPPRTGAAAAVRALAQVGVPRLIYVSCDAPTLGRDTRLLREAGYRLQSAVPLDLFPQTAHFEVVAAFSRS